VIVNGLLLRLCCLLLFDDVDGVTETEADKVNPTRLVGARVNGLQEGIQ
jgi:hypothetical protein